MRISDWSSDVCSSDLLFVWNRAVGATQQGVRINTDLAQLLDRVLRGLGLELARRSNEGHQGQVYESGIVAPRPKPIFRGASRKSKGSESPPGPPDPDDTHMGSAFPWIRRTNRRTPGHNCPTRIPPL